MLKVVSVVDKVDSALDRLAMGMDDYMTNIEYLVADVHPKRPSPEQLETFINAAKDADIIDYQYFKTAEMLRNNYDWLKAKPSLLTHHNPYSIKESDWNDYQINVGNNESIKAELDEITSSPVHHIPLTVDHRFWKFNRDWKPNDRVLMVANRIESKKGVLEVAEACKDLGLKLVLVGSISDPEYFHRVLQTQVVEFHEKISNEALRDLYYSSGLHVCNSVDNFESGTLPLLEAMYCGTPSLSRSVGHVPELSGVYISEGQPKDIKPALESVLKEDLETLRNKAWNSVKNRNNELRAYEYQKLYRSLVSNQPTVSVIVPIYDKPEIIVECLNAIESQTYKNIEIIVVDDNYPEVGNRELVKPLADKSNKPFRYINSCKGDYGLGRARNTGVIEATGEILVFCDQRVIMQPDAIEKFVADLTPKVWLHGNKGTKKDFVENFSCVYRQDLINIGMFNERITEYGGMSQEIRTRAKRNGIRTEFLETAKAAHTGKSSNKHTKKNEIIRMKNILYKVNLYE